LFCGIVLLLHGLFLHGCTTEEKTLDPYPAKETPPSVSRSETEKGGENVVHLVDLAYDQARQSDTIEEYEHFLKRHPDTNHEQDVLERLETLCFEQAKEADTLEGYKQFIYRFPLSPRLQEKFPEVQRTCSVHSHKIDTVTTCREVLKLFPYSEAKAELLQQIQQVEEALKSDRVGYEKHLTTPSGYISVYQRFPLHDAGRQAPRVSNLSAEEIWEKADAFYRKVRGDRAAANPQLEKLYRFFLTYDLISRLRFYRGADAFPGQHDFPEISAYIAERRWFDEYLSKVTENPIYDYKEYYPIQVIMAVHAAAHFFQLPFPTLFCLIFQESKFDFTVVSGVGAVGLGQLTPIGVKQIEKLRGKRKDYEGRLQAATAHLGNVYRDEVFLQILDRMGIEHDFPTLPSTFPKTVGHRFPKAVNADFVKEVAERVQQKGLSFGSDPALLRKKCRLLSRGMMMPDRYAALHGVYQEVMERRFGEKLGNVYNPETNILYSALLLRYYMKYRWCISGQDLELRPLVRSMAAVVSYNQGQTGVRRYLSHTQREFPDLDLNEATLEHCSKLFTKKRLSVHHRGKSGTVKEVYKHATSIGNCACRSPEPNG